jgi:hypothetical protein
LSVIEQVDEQLKKWVASIVDGAEISMVAPAEPGTNRVVRLYLLEVIKSPEPRGSIKPLPLRFWLRYLVTAESSQPEEAHQLLGKLLVAALQNPEFEVESEPVALALWSALGAAPRPSMVLRAPLIVERPQPQSQRVHSLVINRGQMWPLEGRVLGPGDVAVSGAEVSVPAQQLFTRTDYKGRFRFPAVGSGPKGTSLRVRAKGFELTATVADSERAGEPLTLRFERMED